jgi:putative ABC transport system permease protein
MSVVWRKVWRDLALNRSRTILAVLSTAVGIFALGFVVNMSVMMSARIREQTRESRPPEIQIFAAPVDGALVDSIRRQAGIADAEAVRNSMIRWRLADETDWRDASLTGRGDFADQHVSTADLVAGRWPGKKDLVMEAQTMAYFGLQPGDRIVVEHGSSARAVEIVGVVRSTQTIPPQYQGGQGAFFGTLDTLEWLTGGRAFNQINIRLEKWDERSAEQTARRIERQLTAAGLSVGGYDLHEPTFHFAQQIVDGIFIVLTGMGIISLGLSAFLIVNTLNALLAQQVWQIGIFKVVGATSGRVARIYLGVALLYGLMAIAIAVPCSALAAQAMAGWMLGTINVTAGTLQIAPGSILLQLIVGLAVPVLAALGPVVGGSRISCRQAISNHGLGGSFGSDRLDRFLLASQKAVPLLERTPRPVVLSLRNTFRRKARVALTLITLTLGGVMFITVMGVNLSLHRMLDVVLNDFGFDILLIFDKLERSEKLVNLAADVPGVVMAEAWDIRGADIQLPGGEKRPTQVWALPPDSELFHFNIESGRSLLPADDRAVLINRKVAQEDGLRVGDTVGLSFGGRESDWTIVGLIINMNNGQQDSFVPLGALARETGSANRTAGVVVRLARSDLASEKAASDLLRKKFQGDGLTPVTILGVSAVRDANEYQFNLLVDILLTMAILAAVVGSLGLAGTMSINVVERRREIGLMRAIGAATPIVAGIFIGEGLLLGILSWLLAIPLSVPGGYLFTGALSQAIVPMDYAFSIQGTAAWLAIVCVLAVLASLWPAIRATRISVRESLAYE